MFLKIAIIGKFTAEEMGFHIFQTLQRMGHKVYAIEFGPKIHADKNTLRMLRIYRRKIFEIAINSSQKVRDFLLKGTLNRIEEIGNLDLIIVTYDYFTFKEVQEIKKISKSKIVLWFPDAVSNFGRAYFMTADYDYLFLKDPFIVRRLRDYYDFKNVFYLPEAFNSELHRVDNFSDKDEQIYGCDVAVVANLHSFRVPILEKLIQSDYKIKIYGSPPPFYVKVSKKLLSYYANKYLVYEEKAKAWRYARISLNTIHPAEIEGINVRVFEIVGSGGFLLTAYRKALEELFDIGEEIEVFYSYKDMLNKIDYYLKNPIKREEIRRKGQERAIKDHTYEKRLNEMFEIIEKGVR